MTTMEHVNFLPEDYLRRKDRRRTLAIGAGMTMAVVAALGIGVLRAEASLRTAEQVQSAVAHDYDEVAERSHDVVRQHEAQQKVIRQAASAASLVDCIPRSNILAETTNCLPTGAALIELTLESREHPKPAQAMMTAFDLEKAALKAGQSADPFTDAFPFDVSVRITGIADTDVEVARYLSQLNSSSMFQDVSLLISEAYTPPGRKSAPLRRFQMQMTLKSNTQLQPRPVHDNTTTADLSD